MPRPDSHGNISRPAASVDASRLQFRRGQRINLDSVNSGSLFRLEQGCLTCDVLLASGERHIMVLLYPGDLICRNFLPPLPSIGLTAVAPSTITRTTLALGARDEPSVPALHETLAASAARLLARTTLYATAMGRLSAEERLATLLCDIALHLGKQAPGGFTFEVPLSRRDMADHLALNPDSLSRLMSRMKAKGLIALPSRTRAITRDLDALLATTPFGATLQTMRPRTPSTDEIEQVQERHARSLLGPADYSTTRR